MTTKRFAAAWAIRVVLLHAAASAQAGTINAAAEAANARAWAHHGRPCCDAVRPADAAVAAAPLWQRGRAAAPKAGVGFRAAQPVGFRYERALVALDRSRFDARGRTVVGAATLR